MTSEKEIPWLHTIPGLKAFFLSARKSISYVNRLLIFLTKWTSAGCVGVGAQLNREVHFRFHYVQKVNNIVCQIYIPNPKIIET